MKTLFIIGGSGFFGKSILDCFQRGLLEPWEIDHVIVMSRNASRMKYEVPRLVSSDVELISADIGEIETLPIAELVIHAAASTDASKYINNPQIERSNIELAVLNYCNLAKRFHSQSKILFVSSGAVYGIQPSNLMYIPESYILSPTNMISENKKVYALAKRQAENAILNLGIQHGLSVCIARCFAFVGPWLPRNQHFAIGNFLDDALNNREIHVKANHQVYRSYMYSDDLVEWLMTIVSNSNKNCPIYNVGSDYAITISELAKLISDELGVNLKLPEINLDIVDRYIPSILKAKNELGLHIKTNLITAIHSTLDRLARDDRFPIL